MRMLIVLALVGALSGQIPANSDQPEAEAQKQTAPLTEPVEKAASDDQSAQPVAPASAAGEPANGEATTEVKPQQPAVVPPANPLTKADAARADSAPTDPDAPTAKDFIIVLLALSVGLIPATIAKRKGRSFWKWWVYGTFLWWAAIPHALFGKTKAQLMAQRQAEAEAQARAGADAENRRQMAIARLAQMQHAGDPAGYFREKLRQYPRHSQCDCMECGYSGYMGIVDQKKPLHENGLLQLAAFMGTGPARNWYAASAFLGEVAKNILECPNCGSRLEQETGSRPKMLMIGR